MRAWVIAAIAIAGCGEPTREPVCTPRPGDTDLFARLTAHRWGTCTGGFGLCLELAASGSYTARRGEGDISVTDTGRWNFLARDAASGLVCLDDGSVIDFALDDRGLRWGLAGVLPASEPLAIAGSRAALPTVEPVAELYALTANAWEKTNELDLYGQPTQFVLHRDGTFDAAFRHGQCTISGTFSLVVTDHGVELNPGALPNTCDTRGGGMAANIGASNELPAIEGGELLLYGASFRDPASGSDEHMLAFRAYGRDAGLLVIARWPGALAHATPVPWAFTLRNDTSRAQVITSIALSLTPMAATESGFTAIGPASSVYSTTLHETVQPGADHGVHADVTLAGTGLVMLEVDVSSYDDLQRYLNQRHFMLEL